MRPTQATPATASTPAAADAPPTATAAERLLEHLKNEGVRAMFGQLVETVKPDQGVEDQEGRLEVLDGVTEAVPIGWSIQAKRGSGDDFDG